MSENRIMKRIGSGWREELRHVVEAALPERLQVLLERLATLERAGERDEGGANRRRPH
jgi:hypothetical protein